MAFLHVPTTSLVPAHHTCAQLPTTAGDSSPAATACPACSNVVASPSASPTLMVRLGQVPHQSHMAQLVDACRHCHCLQVGRVHHWGFVTNGKRGVWKSQPCQNASDTLLLYHSQTNPLRCMCCLLPPLSVHHELLNSPALAESSPPDIPISNNTG